MRLFHPIVLLLALAAATPAAAQTGPSFDCTKASTEIERAICGDPALAEADRTLAALFASLRTSAFGSGPSNISAGQRAWLNQRDTCLPLERRAYASLNECLLAYYDDRNLELAESAMFAAPELARATVRRLDPDAAPLLEALVFYVDNPGERGPVIALLAAPFEALQTDDRQSYGHSILADGGIADLDDALEWDGNFARTLKMLAVYAQVERFPMTIPCAALVRNPGLIEAVEPAFGSTLDNFIPVSDCNTALPPLPKLEALDEAIWAHWPECEGTIRYLFYRSYGTAVDRARLGVSGEGGNTAKYLDLRVAGVTPRLIADAVAELGRHYRQWRGMDAPDADRSARSAVGAMLDLAHACGG